MPDDARLVNGSWRDYARLRLACRTGIAVFACLLMALPAAHAHGNDEPPSPEMIGWGSVCFVAVLAFIVVQCLRAPDRAHSGFRLARAKRWKLRRRVALTARKRRRR